VDRCKDCFLIYVAEHRNLSVEATVRMALNRVDISPSNLELINILNTRVLLRGSD